MGFASGAQAVSVGNFLSIFENGQSYTLRFNSSQNSAGQAYVLAPDGTGGTAVRVGNLTTVAPGQTVANASVPSGSFQVVQGTATGTTVNNGGNELVFAGGQANNATVNDGGQQTVYAGAVAVGTVLNDPGLQVVSSGGTASGTIISGGEQDVYGLASGSLVESAGLEIVEAGGIASGTVISSGGTATVYGSDIGATLKSGASELVSSGGSTINATISGGTLQIGSGGAVTGSLVFATSTGVLQVDAGALVSGVISGFAPGDELDLAQANFDGSGSVELQGGNVLQVSAGGLGYQLNFDSAQDFSAQSFVLLPDASGNTAVELGQVRVISAGQTVSGDLVSADEFELVYGTAVGTSVGSGGVELILSGGSGVGETIGSGGEQIVYAGATASGTAVQGKEFLLSGSIATSATISGEQDVYGTTSGTNVANGGMAVVLNGGLAAQTTIGDGGVETVGSGGFASSGTLESGAAEIVSSGGTDVATFVGSGGSATVDGSAIGTAVASGGTLNIGADGDVIELDGEVLQGTTINAGTLDFELGSGSTLTGDLIGSGAVLVGGSGTLVPSGADGFAGSFVLDGGTRELTSAGAAGSGVIAFNAIAGAALQVDSHAMPGNLIVGFGPGDEIDLAGVPFDSGGSIALTSGNILQMSLPRSREGTSAKWRSYTALASMCPVLCVVVMPSNALTRSRSVYTPGASAAVSAWATRTMHLFRVASGSASGFTMMSPPASDSNAT